MHCPACGVEVVQEAGFCHKCGKRLDFEEEQFPTYDGTPSSPGETPAEQTPPETAEQPPAEQPTEQTPAGRFMEGIGGSKALADEPEEQLWKGGYSSKAMLGTWVFSGVITVGLLIFGIVLAVKWSNHTPKILLGMIVIIVFVWIYQFTKLCFRRLNIRYTLTTQRFVHESGILRRVTDRIELIDVDDVTVSQRLLERMVGVGTITITSSDATHPKLVMPGIGEVKRIGGLVDESRRAERRRRGLHVERI